MIEEAGVVVTVEPDAVWVATQRKTTCGSCSARMTCGQGLMTSLASDRKLDVIKLCKDLVVLESGQVTLGMPDELLMRSAFLVYMLLLLAISKSALGVNALKASVR